MQTWSYIPLLCCLLAVPAAARIFADAAMLAALLVICQRLLVCRHTCCCSGVSFQGCGGRKSLCTAGFVSVLLFTKVLLLQRLNLADDHIDDLLCVIVATTIVHWSVGRAYK